MAETNIDYGVVKRPGNDEDLSPEEVEEYLRCAEDFWEFAKHCKVTGPKGETTFQPRQYQVEMLDIINNNRFCVVNAPRQAGKRLSLDTIVPTPEGYSEIGQIKVGDKIIGKDGRPAKVTYLSPIEDNPDAYKVTFATGEEVLADAEHLWEVNEGYKKKVVNTEYMIDRGVITSTKPSGSTGKRFSIDTCSPIDLPEKDLPIDPYIFGYWLGDGGSNGNYIFVGKNQGGDLENITSYLDDIGTGYSVLSPSYDEPVYHLRIDDMFPTLKRMGCINNKHIPTDYLRGSIRQRELLIQGILDSDGSISRERKGRIEIMQKSKTLIYDIHELLSSMGTRFPLPKEKVVKQFNPEGDIYYRLSGSLYLDNYQPFRLKRKLDLVPQSPHKTRTRSTKKRQIVSIEPIDPVPMRCIQVDNEDHLFCVGRSFIPTHNTQTMAVYLVWVTTFFSDSTSGFTSFKLTNVRDFIRRCQQVYESLPDFLKQPVIKYNTSEIAFSNNSMIYAETSSESALRGKTISNRGVAVLDELAHVTGRSSAGEGTIAHEMLDSLLPSLEAAGEDAVTKVVAISTPNTSIGKYAELVNGAIEGSNGWVYYKVDPDSIPGRTPEWERKMLRKMNKNKYLQEFRGAFLSDNSGLINSDIIEDITPTPPVEEIGDLKLYTNNLKGMKVCIGVDVSEGVGRDNSCFQIYDIDTLDQVGEFANNVLNQTQYFKKIVQAIHLLHQRGVNIEESHLGVESNGIGNGILRLLENSEDDLLHSLNMISDVDKNGIPTGKPGITMTNPVKMEGCGVLKDLVEEEKLTIRSMVLLNELRMFTKHGATFKAESGKDDRVMASLLVMLMLKQIAHAEEGVFDKINQVTMDNENDEVFDIFF